MAQLGADVEALDQLGKSFDSAAKEIQQAVNKINGKVSSVWWKGKDADTFRSNWTGQYKPSLNKVSEALEAMGKQVKSEAQQQRLTSGQG